NGQGLERWESEQFDHLQDHCDVELQPMDDAIVTACAFGPVEREAEIAAVDDLVADLPVAIDATHVREEHTRLSWNVRAHVPGGGARVERDVGGIVDVL